MSGAEQATCPCGSELPLASCCQPIIEGTEKAATAEALLRARYTAFTQAKVDFILQTHHPRTRDEVSRESIQEWAEKSEWLGLQIHHVEGGGPEDTEGRIRFVARYRHGAHEIDHVEEALFERQEGSWYFVTGRQPPVRRTSPKIGRNDPCPCGSGKKYKRCCGAVQAPSGS
ncbi:MAG: UPF0225 protein [Planctomycetota bacterium]|nr:MAG: UPF0225 protein [Planctomycetota bacterium]